MNGTSEIPGFALPNDVHIVLVAKKEVLLKVIPDSGWLFLAVPWPAIKAVKMLLVLVICLFIAD